ncbi:transcription factor SPT20 homolog [Clytia hemisphaerica]|uniref:Uncharacterized protein n=1 Tax=Clytia hemisphaerica TaxID=252671 RepID=A0A7M5U4V5_9CNID
MTHTKNINRVKMQSVVETPASYFNNSSTINLSNGEIVNYDDFDNYTMHSIQQKIIENSTNNAVPSKPSQSENPSEKRPLRIARQNTDMDAKDSNGQPFRARSNRYNHVKSRVDSNLQNLNIRSRSFIKKQDNEQRKQDTELNNSSPSIIGPPPPPKGYPKEKESRVQTGVVWRKTMIVPNNNNNRSMSASPNVQHTSPKDPSNLPIPSDSLPYRSRSASTNDAPTSSLLPTDFTTYVNKSTTLIDSNKGVNDSIRLYRSYLSKKRTKLPDDDSFENKIKEYEDEKVFTHTFIPTNSRPPMPSLTKHQQQQYNQTTSQPLIQPIPPIQNRGFPPSRPISEHFTSSTDRRIKPIFFGDDSNELPKIQNRRPASEYHQHERYYHQDNPMNGYHQQNAARLSFSFPDPKPRSQIMVSENLQQNYKDTFDYLNKDYLKDNERRLSHSLDSVQKKVDLSNSLSRQASMVLERLQLQQKQREQEQRTREQLLQQEQMKREQQEQQKREQLLQQQKLKDEEDKRQRRLHDAQQNLKEQKLSEHQRIEEQYRLYEEQKQREKEQLQQKQMKMLEQQKAREEDQRQKQKLLNEEQQHKEQQIKLEDQYRLYEQQRTLKEQEHQQKQKLQEYNRTLQDQRIHQQKAFDPSENILRKAELSLAENIRFLQQLQTQALPPISKSANSQVKENPPNSNWSLPDTSNNNLNTIQPVTTKKSALKKTSNYSSSVPYLNYANSFFNNHIDQGSSSKKKKKSVQIALERNRMHFYTPDF